MDIARKNLQPRPEFVKRECDNRRQSPEADNPFIFFHQKNTFSVVLPINNFF